MGQDTQMPLPESHGRGDLFGAEDRDLLVRIARAMYPHDRLANAPYARAVDAILHEASRNPVLAVLLVDGLTALRDAVPLTSRDILGAITDHLRTVESGPFFSSVRARVSWALYDDLEVWEFIGYPGESFRLGGYLSRGFDDLDWLPAPRVTESAEPLVAITVAGPGDQNPS